MALREGAAALPGHPAPHRERVGLGALLFGACAAPLAWAAQLNLNYALASHACFPSDVSRTGVLPGWDGFRVELVVVNLVALAIALVATAISWRSWRIARHERENRAEHLLEAGEGRTRFFAACGLLSGPGFACAILFNSVALITVPPCAG